MTILRLAFENVILYMELHWTYLSLHKRIFWNNAVVKNKQTEMQDPKLLKICKSEEMLKDMRLLYMPEDIIPLFWSAFGQERCSFTWSRKQLNFTKSILLLYLCGIAIVHFRTSQQKCIMMQKKVNDKVENKPMWDVW